MTPEPTPHERLRRTTGPRDPSALPRRPRRQPAAPARAEAGARGPRRRADRRRRTGRRRGRGGARRRRACSERSACGRDGRRVPARVLAHGLHLRASAASTRSTTRTCGSSSTTRTATSSSRPPPPTSTSRVRLEGRSSGTRSPSCARPSRDGVTPKLTIPSPSMVHYRGGRAAIDRASTRTWTAFWTDLTRRLRGRSRAASHDLGCRYLQLDDTSLAYLNDPEQRRHVAADRRRPGPPARDVHRQHQPRAGGPARTTCASPRTCAGATSPRRGWLRAATTSSPRPCSAGSRSTASSWSTTTSAPAASSRCASCRRASRSCSAWSPPSGPSWRARTCSSAASTRPRATWTSTSSACRRSAASPPRWRATS